MADYTTASAMTQQELLVKRLLASQHIIIPATVQRFMPGPPQRVTVQPMTQLKVMVEGEPQYVDPPIIEDVPYFVPYAQGTGLMLTLPVAAGDTVLLLIPDKPIDNALAQKGVTRPVMYTDARIANVRAHALTDAIAISLFTQDPDGIPTYNTARIELRNKSRSHYINLGNDGITASDSQATWDITAGKFTLTALNGIDMSTDADVNVSAQGGINMTTPELIKMASANFNTGQNGASGESTITGSLRSTQGTFTDSNGTSLTTHTHPYTDDGAGMNTSAPNAGS